MTDTVNVPREPTDAMLKAWDDYRHNSSGVKAWSAMLAAAPKAEPVSHPAPASDELLSIVKELRDAGNGLFVLKNNRGDYGYFDDLADRIIAMDARLTKHKGPQ